MSRKLAPVLLAVLAFTVAACEETTTTTEKKQDRVWLNKNKDPLTRAEAYAFFVSGEEGPCPLGPGEVGKKGNEKETFACINTAAFAGCFEALQGLPFETAAYKRDFPEPLMFSSAQDAYKKCRSFR